MNKTDKIIILFYIVLAISYSTYIFETSSSLDNLELPDILPKPITDLTITKKMNIDREQIFRIMTDVSNYPNILPQNIISVKIIEQNKNLIIAEETVIEKGIKTTLLVKHIITPFQTHSIEILEGNAKKTTIIQNFKSISDGTTIETNIHFELQGILSPLSFLPKSNFEHAMNTILTNFEQYAKISEDRFAKIVDDAYREILFRPADIEGLQYYSKLLKNDDITENGLRESLLNSEEKKNTLSPGELLNISDLSSKTQSIIHKLYLEFLTRPVDPVGLQYYGTLLETGKITQDDLRDIIFNSDEALKVRLHDDPILIEINNLYMEIFGQHANSATLLKHSKQIIDNQITFDELRKYFLNLKNSTISD